MQQIGHYIVKSAGEQNEGFTEYHARCGDTGAAVRLKVVAEPYATDPYFRRRWQRLMTRISELEHPNIEQVLAVEATEQHLYVVQPPRTGRPLAEILATEGPFSLKRMQYIAGEIGAALDYAHHHGVLHGELSAQAIYVDEQDNLTVVAFSEAQLLFGADLVPQMNAVRAPEVLAPERARGQGPSRQADLYSLGILCYQMLANEPPFNGAASAVFHAQAYRQPKPIHLLNPGVPLPLSEVISRMLSKSVDLRYHTAAEFIRSMAVTYRSEKVFHYNDFRMVYEAVQRRHWLDRAAVYFTIVLVFLLMSMTMAIWAGFQTGREYSARQAPTQPTQTPTPLRLISMQPTPTTVAVQLMPLTPSTPAGDRLLMRGDGHQATPSPTATETPAPLPTETLLPTPTTMEIMPVVAIPATPTAAISTGAVFAFSNPTGHDLVLDFSGTAYHSEIVPPYSRQEIILQPGNYQVIIHGIVGGLVPTKVGNFSLPPGQQTEWDFYGEYDQVLE